MSSPALSFINYIPKSAELGEFVKKRQAIPSRQLEAQLHEASQKSHQPLPSAEQLVSTANKANWDLKRDVDKRLRKLNKQTQLAIYELGLELNKEEEQD